MNTPSDRSALFVREDGQIYLIADLPVHPKDVQYLKLYEVQLGSAKNSALRVENQKEAKKIIMDNFGLACHRGFNELKHTIYPIPDLKWEVWEDKDYTGLYVLEKVNGICTYSGEPKITKKAVLSPSSIETTENMKYRKKPVVIDAIRWTGCMRSFEEIKQFCPDIIDGGAVWHPYAPPQEPSTSSWPLFIQTLEGNMAAEIGDYIIKGVKGEFYPCKPDIFEMSYEKV